MTLEEAQSLGPDDIIEVANTKSNRILNDCHVNHSNLLWSEKKNDGSISKGHSWPYRDINLIKKVYNGINNNYSIF